MNTTIKLLSFVLPIILLSQVHAMGNQPPAKNNSSPTVNSAPKQTLPDEFKADGSKKPCAEKAKKIEITPPKLGLGSGGCKAE